MLAFPQLLEIVVLSFLAAAAINDLKKREVPNWVNYGLVAAGFGFAILQSIIAADWHFLLYSIVGAGIALAFAALMFYTGQWGGGDSKLMIGLGAILGLPFELASPFVSLESPLVAFFTNLVFISFFYAILVGGIMALRNRRKFARALSEQAKSSSVLRKVVLGSAALSLIVALLAGDPAIRLALAALIIAMLLSLYLSMMAKAVEKSCMLKLVSPLKLTEGDWIAKDVFVSGKKICGPKDLGIEKKQIRQLIALYKRKKIRTVLVKEGIPFAPSFFVAYVATVIFGNLFLVALK